MERSLRYPFQATRDARLTEIYRYLDAKYPKFHKMDNLSKAGFGF